MISEFARRWWVYAAIFILVFAGTFIVFKTSFVRHMLAKGPTRTLQATTTPTTKENAGSTQAKARYEEFASRYEQFWSRELIQCSNASTTLYGASVAVSGYGDGELYMYAPDGAEFYFHRCGVLPNDGCDILEERGSRQELETYKCVKMTTTGSS